MSKKNTNKSKRISGDTIFALSVVGACIALLAVIVYFGKEDPVELVIDPIDINTENQVSIGNPEAPIEVVQFFDFQCVHCQSWDQEMFDDFNQKYVESGEVKYTLINFPFLGKTSEDAALLFETVYGIAGSEDAVSFKRNVFISAEALGEDNTEAFYTKNLLAVAKEIVTAEQFTQIEESFKNKDYAPALDIDQSIAKNANVLGTPAVYVNNVFVSNPFDRDAFYEQIDAEINK